MKLRFWSQQSVTVQFTEIVLLIYIVIFMYTQKGDDFIFNKAQSS